MIEVPLVMVTASVKVAPKPRTGPPSLNEAKGVSAGSGIELSEMKMPTLAAQITIGDYAKWRPVFDKHKPLRDKAGLTNVRVYRDADNPKELIVWSETSDTAKAREALNSPEIRSAMQEAGVMGPPKIHVIP